MKNPDSPLIIANIVAMVILALAIIIVGFKITKKLEEKSVDKAILGLSQVKWDTMNKATQALGDPAFLDAVKDVQQFLDKIKNLVGGKTTLTTGSDDGSFGWLDKINNFMNNFSLSGLVSEVKTVGDQIAMLDIAKFNDAAGEFKTVGEQIGKLDVTAVNSTLGNVQKSWDDIQNGLKQFDRLSNDLDEATITSFKNIINNQSVQSIAQNLCDPINIPVEKGLLLDKDFDIIGKIQVPNKNSTISVQLPGCAASTENYHYDFY